MGIKTILKKIGLGAVGVAAVVPSPISGIAGAAVEALKGAGIIKDPAAEAAARQALLNFEAEMAEKELRYLEAINATMRAEAQSEHWAQWLWRPVVGFTFSATIINNYILLPYFASQGLVPIIIPGEVWSAMLVILGVAAGTRGWEKILRERNGNNSNSH